jgi:ubiquinol-cytochrome c reductase cytochrome c1 subunit
MRKSFLPALAPVLSLAMFLALPLLVPVAALAEGGPELPKVVEEWHAGNDVSNIASLQRGARNVINYCLPCHSMKYVRWSRMGEDLHIPTNLLVSDLMPPDAKPGDYIESSLHADDAVTWFGKQPPDLSLIARSRGTDKVYRFLKSFYDDPSRPAGSNNIILPAPAMPAVLSELEGVKAAVYKNEETVVDGKPVTGKVFDHFEKISPGQLTDEQFDDFVRDTVNFLDYAGEPAQVDRRSTGVWVVLFLLVLTWFAWMLKKEYWKDVH